MSETRWQDDYREQVERMLERLLPSERDELFAGVIDAMRYSLLGGGNASGRSCCWNSAACAAETRKRRFPGPVLSK